MMPRPLILKLTGLFVLMFAAATSSRANSVIVRGGSAYGSDKGTTVCENAIVGFLNSGLNPEDASNCDGYTPGTFTIGSNTYSGDVFSFLSGGGSDFGTIDVILMPAASTPTTPAIFSLNLANITDQTGVFMCGSGSQGGTSTQSFVVPSGASPTDSTAELAGLYCTPGSSTDPSLYVDPQGVAGVSMSFTATGVTFTNTNGTADPIAVFTSDGNIQGATFTPGSPVSTPEPSSLILLGLGLLAVGWKFKSVQPGARPQTSV
jgi:PEP-CTERM motif